MVFESSAINIIALVLIVVSAIKIVVILVKPGAWVNVVKKIWSSPMMMSGISLILGAIVLYYLIQSGLTIVQIMAVTAFVALLMAVGIGMYANEVVGMAKKLLNRKMLKRMWLYIIIWIALLVWTAYALFA